jgi:hypothetical protein
VFLIVNKRLACRKPSLLRELNDTARGGACEEIVREFISLQVIACRDIMVIPPENVTAPCGEAMPSGVFAFKWSINFSCGIKYAAKYSLCI